ncbi:hypothetical protein SUGI_1048970 [Cryptomeria japonica]|nr:hypothetical protein SUGI_1048970 [Cryptomeria japonica]
MWCYACNMPYAPSLCAVAKGLQEEENGYEEHMGDPTVNMISFAEEGGSDSMNIDQCSVITNINESIKLRIPTEEEKRRITAYAIAQAKRTYDLRNRVVNPKQSKLTSLFIKENDETPKQTNKVAKTKEDVPKNNTRGPDVQKEYITKFPLAQHSISFDISNALTQLKVSIPLMEIMKFPEYREKTLEIILGVQKEKVNEQKQEVPKGNNNEQMALVIYLGSTITKNPTQVDPFYLTLVVNNKKVKNCMIDSGAAINVMPVGVMKELGLEVDTTFGKCYAMDNRSVLVVGIMKDVEFKLAAYPEASYKTDITVVDVPPNYGMLLSRQWSNMIGGYV